MTNDKIKILIHILVANDICVSIGLSDICSKGQPIVLMGWFHRYVMKVFKSKIACCNIFRNNIKQTFGSACHHNLPVTIFTFMITSTDVLLLWIHKHVDYIFNSFVFNMSSHRLKVAECLLQLEILILEAPVSLICFNFPSYIYIGIIKVLKSTALPNFVLKN